MEAAEVTRVGPTGEKRTFHSFRHNYAKARSRRAAREGAPEGPLASLVGSPPADPVTRA